MQPQKTPEHSNSVLILRGDEVVAEVKNLRMRRSVLLLAELLKGDSPPAVSHFAVGSGIGTGTLTLPQDPVVTGETLREEVYRQGITTSYHDTANVEGDTITDGTRSNKVLYSTTLAGADADALITEAALFGGEGAASENGGDMIAWITFPVIDNRTGGQNPDAPEDLTFNWVLKIPLVQEG